MTDIPPCPNSAEDAGSGSANIRIAIIQKAYLVIRYRLQKAIKPPHPGPQTVTDCPGILQSNPGPSWEKFQFNNKKKRNRLGWLLSLSSYLPRQAGA